MSLLHTITTDVLNPVVPATAVSHHFDYICVWPDGVYCAPDELAGMSHRSDDYANVAVGPDQLDWEVADAYLEHINGKLAA